MAWPPLTAEYERNVHARGMVFISQLPANTNLGPKVAGAPGARTAWRADQKPTYELAPLAVRLEMGWTEIKGAVADAPGKVALQLDEVVTPLVEASGLDHGILGVLAKALGVPLSLLVLLLVIVGYLMLRQSRLVPALGEITK